MLDLDGTTIPNKSDGMPSKKVKEAIKEVSKKVNVSVVTGRPYQNARHIINELDLKDLAVVAGGTSIIDVEKEKIIWEKKISKKDTKEIFQFLFQRKLSSLVTNNGLDQEFWVNSGEVFPFEPTLITLPHLSISEAESIFEELKIFEDIAVHKMVGWKKNTIWLHIMNIEASKQHAIYEVSRILGIETDEIIGVGDGYNDFPLLMACGLKVAMGNAVDELKAIADYIAPTVEQDGVADVIEKFIL